MEFVTLDEEGEVDGSIKGYFSGKLEAITPDEEPLHKPKDFKSPFTEAFNF